MCADMEKCFHKETRLQTHVYDMTLLKTVLARGLTLISDVDLKSSCHLQVEALRGTVWLCHHVCPLPQD
jgi:hypothetical protein